MCRARFRASSQEGYQKERLKTRLKSRTSTGLERFNTNPFGLTVRRFAGPTHFAGCMRPLRIAHITDQHVGTVTPHAAQKAAVKLVNETHPDLVVITGDFVCHSQQHLDALSEVVAELNAPAMGVLGNHDHWSGAGEIRTALKTGGVEILDNSHTTITLGGQPLRVVGLDDAYTGHADRTRAVKGLNLGSGRHLPTIGLSHIAEEADGLWHAGVPLVFSGHTHAGHVTLAGLHDLIIGRVAGHKYVHGLYGCRGRDLPADAVPRGAVYVGAGIGSSVVPFRLGDRAQREVAVFELGARPDDFHEPHIEQRPKPGRKPSPERSRGGRRRFTTNRPDEIDDARAELKTENNV